MAIGSKCADCGGREHTGPCEANMHRCVDCKHYEWAEVDSSDGHPDENAGPFCGARHGVQNLKQFPFKKTGCKHFEHFERK